jgi:putative CRISPR-associated protein (TIGR02620 family)
MKIDVIVTRHPGLINYLIELGLATTETKVIEHATPNDITNKHVCGVLPHSLSKLCTLFTEIPLNIPLELRGKELSTEQVRKYAGTPTTYSVKVVNTFNNCYKQFFTDTIM